jgi:predicted DCC family thiol-disulfide oxidoreductase YuxK
VSQFESVLIYDGECPYCSVAARALERVQDVGAISWYDESAQAFLRAQFGATPFAMVLVDASEERVYAGESAAQELTGRAGMPELVGSLVRDNYETIARVVGLASNRGRDPDDVHEQYDLTAEAAEQFGTLAANAVDRDIRESDGAPADTTRVTSRDG